MAEATIRLLFDMIEEKAAKKYQVFEAELIEGGSTRRLEA